MKLTRRQLRKLILESVVSEIRVKPGGDIDPDHLEKLEKMIDTGDKQNIRQADELASMVGHDSDHLSQDLKRYDYVSIMGIVGEFAHKLTDEDMQMLMKLQGENLIYSLHSWSGFGFTNETEGRPELPPDDLYDMATRIATQVKDPQYSRYDDIDDATLHAMNKLSKAIIALANKTTITNIDLEDAGIGENIGSMRSKKYKFYDRDYEKLWQDKKLFISGIFDFD